MDNTYQTPPPPIFSQLIYFSSIMYFTQKRQLFVFINTIFYPQAVSYVKLLTFLSNFVHKIIKSYKKPAIKTVKAVQTSRTPQFKTDKTVKTTQIHITQPVKTVQKQRPHLYTVKTVKTVQTPKSQPLKTVTTVKTVQIPKTQPPKLSKLP